MTETKVQIENVNMPFWAIVGFIIKVYFAGLVASLMVGFMSGILFLILMFVLTLFGIVVGGH